MRLERLWLTDFRSYESADVGFAPRLTAVVGANGEGKSNLVEAIAYLATLSSFRGAPPDALVRQGAAQATVRAEGERDGRRLLLEAEVNRSGRNRILVNRQRLPRARDLLGALRVTVFSPDDLHLVKGGPAARRDFLDATIVSRRPAHDAVRSDLERALRQRNALLKQAGGRMTDEVATTLEVWDAKLADAGDRWGDLRAELVERLGPVVAGAYRSVAGRDDVVALAYEAPWRSTGLAEALADARRDDLRRGVTTVGPHRDELALVLADRPARTQASQGEQRCIALALRLGAHHVVSEVAGSEPVLLLDDVFSELDPIRSAALLAHLPAGQTVLTTAGALPTDAEPDLVLRIEDGRVRGGAS